MSTTPQSTIGNAATTALIRALAEDGPRREVDDDDLEVDEDVSARPPHPRRRHRRVVPEDQVGGEEEPGERREQALRAQNARAQAQALDPGRGPASGGHAKRAGKENAGGLGEACERRTRIG